MTNTKYPNLFSPIKIGKVEIKNRIAMTTTCTDSCTHDGYITEEFKAWWAARAKGGTGLLISGPSITLGGDRLRTYFTPAPAVFSDRYNPGLASVSEICHHFGAKIFFQMGSSGFGRQSKFDPEHPDDYFPNASANVPSYYMQEDNLPESMLREYKKRRLGFPFSNVRQSATRLREVTKDEIIAQEDSYASCAERLYRCGFDGVEIHHAHGYLGYSFLSPRLNYRRDEYGGSLENRMRFLMNSLRKTRAAVPDNFAVGIRTSIEEHVEGGLTRDDVKVICKEAERLGANYICFSDGTWENFKYMFPSEPGTMLEGAADIRKEINIPVITPSLDDPDMAEKAIKEGKTDFAGIARGLVADPNWVNKVAKGEKPVKCIRCDIGCIGRIIDQQLPIRCVVNPECGFEENNPEYRMRESKWGTWVSVDRWNKGK